jgi:hypothetical protein
MKSKRSISAVLAGMLLLPAMLSGAAAPKAAVPSEDEQAGARAELRRLLGADLLRGAAAPDLAQKLLENAQRHAANPALRYALLIGARDAAARSGELALATEAAQRVVDGFAVPDPLAFRADALLACAKGLSAPATHDQAARLALALAWAAIRDARHDLADRRLQFAEKSAAQGVSLGLPRRVARDREVLAGAKREAAIHQVALRTLKSAPDDPGAHLAVGRYLCFVKLDWPAGLAHLARGKDPLLRKLAEQDLKADQLSDGDLLLLADGWHAAADVLPSGPAQVAMRQRAASHYRTLLALWGANADRQLEQRRIEVRLAAAPSPEDGSAGAVARSPQVQEALRKAIAALYQQYNAKGHWEPDPNPNARWTKLGLYSRQEGGVSAVVVHALLLAGETPPLSPKLRATIDFLAGADLDGTYALSYRVQSLGPLSTPNSPARRVITQDVAKLVRGTMATGFYTYRCPPGPDAEEALGERLAGGDLSCTQHAWLALAEAGRRGISLPPRAWATIAGSLLRNQLEDGGWAYPQPANSPRDRSSASMTAAACTVLLLAQPHVGRPQQPALREAVLRGMAFLDESFQSTGGTDFGDPAVPQMAFRNGAYLLVTIQRLGHISGRTAFNQTDWYDAGCRWLISRQNADGSFGSGTPSDTALALIFLARGRAE